MDGINLQKRLMDILILFGLNRMHMYLLYHIKYNLH
nr:MAG TPA: hypothetical protein [Bacteriophage sp.]